MKRLAAEIGRRVKLKDTSDAKYYTGVSILPKADELQTPEKNENML